MPGGYSTPPAVGFRAFLDGTQRTQLASYLAGAPIVGGHAAAVIRERQNARYDAVVESASDAILTLDATGLVQFANSAALRETSFERAELVGRPLDHLFEEPRRWQELWDTVLSGDAPGSAPPQRSPVRHPPASA